MPKVLGGAADVQIVHLRCNVLHLQNGTYPGLLFQLGAALDGHGTAVNRQQVSAFRSDSDELGVEVPDAPEVD